jgi:hypothetical protein
MPEQQMFIALVLNALENYVGKRTQENATISEQEAKLFASNCSVVVRAVLDSGVELIAPPAQGGEHG